MFPPSRWSYESWGNLGPIWMKHRERFSYSHLLQLLLIAGERWKRIKGDFPFKERRFLEAAHLVLDGRRLRSEIQVEQVDPDNPARVLASHPYLFEASSRKRRALVLMKKAGTRGKIDFYALKVVRPINVEVRFSAVREETIQQVKNHPLIRLLNVGVLGTRVVVHGVRFRNGLKL